MASRFGDWITDNLTVKGDFLLENAVQDDLTIEMTAVKINPLNSKPDYDYDNVALLFPQNDTTEYVTLSKQLKHKRKAGSRIFPHIHIQQTQDTQCKFVLEYKLYNLGEAVPATYTTIELDTYAFDYLENVHQILTNAVGIDGTGITGSAMFEGKLYRDDNVYTADVIVKEFDLHIFVDKLGENI